jgi:clan AA aspartic protease
MGTVHAEITLKNAADMARVRDGHLKERDLRSATVTALADTGAMTLVITEELCQTLGLSKVDEKIIRTASGQRLACKVTEPVDIHWKNRSSSQRAVVIPGAEDVLLGAIPLEDMDLMVNPVTQEPVGIHGDIVECIVM